MKYIDSMTREELLNCLDLYKKEKNSIEDMLYHSKIVDHNQDYRRLTRISVLNGFIKKIKEKLFLV